MHALSGSTRADILLIWGDHQEVILSDACRCQTAWHRRRDLCPMELMTRAKTTCGVSTWSRVNMSCGPNYLGKTRLMSWACPSAWTSRMGRSVSKSNKLCTYWRVSTWYIFCFDCVVCLAPEPPLIQDWVQRQQTEICITLKSALGNQTLNDPIKIAPQSFPWEAAHYMLPGSSPHGVCFLLWVLCCKP